VNCVRAAFSRTRNVLFLLFGASLLLRVASFAGFPHPAYPDSFYYVAVARQIAAGHGLIAPYLWSFVDVGSRVPAVGVLPLSAFFHWMPLAALIQVPFIWLLGPTDLASTLPFLFLGALLAPLTYLLSREAFGVDVRPGWNRAPLLAAIIALLPAYFSPFLGQPDNYALFAVLAIGALWLVARAWRGDRRRAPLIFAGIFAGGAFLSRTDGLLVAVAVGVLFAVEMARAARAHRPRRLSISQAFAFAATTLLLVAPWLMRQWLTFGSLSPSAASGRILWIRDYSELFSADGPLSPSYLLSWAPDKLIGSRIDAGDTVLSIVGLGLLSGVFAIFALIGLRRRWRISFLVPFLGYTALFWAWSVIVAAPHLATGNFLHSAGAFLPLLYILAAEGAVGLIGTLAKRFSHFDPLASARRMIFLFGGVAAAGTLIFTFTTLTQWQAYRDQHLAAVAWLEKAAPGGTVLMSSDPGGFYTLDSDLPGIQTPTSDLAVQAQVARVYGAKYLLLEKRSLAAALRPVLAGTVHPAWLTSGPLFVIPAKLLVPGASPSPDDALPELAIYGILPQSP
jgi:4-amino-4-deoxy-L-arabinose transferase-like glycosyltransferase